MNSWKTTVGGILAAVGTGLMSAEDPKWLSLVGKICNGVGIAIIGISARDNDVSSEQAGVKK